MKSNHQEYVSEIVVVEDVLWVDSFFHKKNYIYRVYEFHLLCATGMAKVFDLVQACQLSH